MRPDVIHVTLENAPKRLHFLAKWRNIMQHHTPWYAPYVNDGGLSLPSWTHRIAHWAIRLPLAALLYYYGIQKFPDAFVAPDGYGVPAPLFILAAFGEIFAAAALIAGGIIETLKPKNQTLRLLGDITTRTGGLAALCAIMGVIVFFYWDNFTLNDPYAIKLGLAAYLLYRGNT